VTDTGIGIPREMQQKLFTPFAQGDESTSRRFGGTGLGLSICQRLAEAMGGSICIESEPGEGATFIVELAVDIADDLSGDSPAAFGNAGAMTLMTFASARVLVAEDQPSGRNVIRRQLAQLSIDPLIVNDGQQAYDAYLSGQFDLLITDCHMPNVNGFELTRMIRRHEQGNDAHLPILAFTANALKGEAEFCFSAGMDAYVVKPASLAQLSEKIGELLGPGEPKVVGPMLATGAATAESVDFTALAKLVGEEDEAELRSIVVEYLATADPTFRRARLALEQHDLIELKEVSHAGKGSAMNVCARPLAAAWIALEADALAGEFGSAAGHLIDLEARLRDLKNTFGLVSSDTTESKER
jgi:CheY-like chemotaxis protein